MDDGFWFHQLFENTKSIIKIGKQTKQIEALQLRNLLLILPKGPSFEFDYLFAIKLAPCLLFEKTDLEELKKQDGATF